MGVAGVIYSNVLACIITAAVSLPYSLRGSALKVSWPAVRSLITFSAPLGIANVTNSYALSADRFFLGRMASLYDVGLYALGARLSQAFLVLVYQPFQQVWDAEKYKLVNAGPEGTRLPAVFSLMNYVLIAAALALALVAPDALALLSAPQFRGAATIVPLFLVAQILTANSDFVRVSTMAAGRTKMVLVTALVAAVVITPALLILIPLFGGRGAATAIILGSLVRLFIDHRVARRSNPISLPWTRTALLAAVACGCWAVGSLGTASMSVFFALLAKAGLVAVFLVVGWGVPLMTREARQLATTLLAHALDLVGRRAAPGA
jgi:O-antigen/teichoic acid export membrane protein